jgi:hypothetical protein
VNGGTALHGVVRGALVAALLVLVALAYASPPDPGWISGLWDDDDHDDAVLRITAGAAAVEPFPLDHASMILPAKALSSQTHERSAVDDARAVLHARAPPSL